MIQLLRNRIILLTLFIMALLLLTNCAKKQLFPYSGPDYPPTQQVTVNFLPEQVTDNCLVFAHLLVTIPPGKTGKDIADIISAEAKLRGADIVLVGQGRESDEDSDLEFRYFGPVQEYLCKAQWCGWKYGYELWEKQGQWVGIGFAEWDNQDQRYDHSIMLQIAFLSCSN